MISRPCTKVATVAVLTGLLLAANAVAADKYAPLALKRQPDLAKGVAALPRISPATTPAYQAINKLLDKSDKEYLQNHRDCMKERDAEDFRTIDVSVAADRLLLIEEHIEIYCGGPYPVSARKVITYDTKSGRPVDWVRMLPGTVRMAYPDLTDQPEFVGEPVGLVSRRLQAELITWTRREHPDCLEEVTRPNLTLYVAPDPKGQGLVVWPELPHVIQVCIEHATIPMTTLRKWGANRQLLTDMVRMRPWAVRRR